MTSRDDNYSKLDKRRIRDAWNTPRNNGPRQTIIATDEDDNTNDDIARKLAKKQQLIATGEAAVAKAVCC